jgi:hypothetical protein
MSATTLWHSLQQFSGADNMLADIGMLEACADERQQLRGDALDTQAGRAGRVMPRDASRPYMGAIVCVASHTTPLFMG